MIVNKYLLFLSVLFLFSCSDEDNIDDQSTNQEEIPVEIQNVKYRVTFAIDWNSTDFPTNYPESAHFSRLIGWSHKPNHSFFKLGTTASEGIKDMAELGANTNLTTEIESKITNKEGLDFVLGSSLGSGTGDVSVVVEVNNLFPSVTLASMIAPSPDWYIAVVNVDLLNGGDSFVSSLSVNAQSYDAGTDSGTDYTSSNNTSNPQQVISLLSYKEITQNNPLAKVTFTKIE